MGMLYTKEQIFIMSLPWQNIILNNCKVKELVEIAKSAVTSSEIRSELRKPLRS